MSDNLARRVWLIGVGPMGVEYAKVMAAIGVPFVAIGRGRLSAETFRVATGITPEIFPLEELRSKANSNADCVIIAVSVDQLASVTKQVIESGLKRILVEKPAGLSAGEVRAVASLARMHQAEVSVAYNRRFYSSVLEGEKLISEDGGVTSFSFEFTEWSHVVEKFAKSRVIKNNWFLANSTHVVDLAFFLGGKPKEISSFVKGGTAWHPRGAVFSGAGVSETGALFSYIANWKSPGRWGIELMTEKHRLIYRPLELLSVQEIGNVSINPVSIDDIEDRNFKPGLFREVTAFLAADTSRLPSITDQSLSLDLYEQKILTPVGTFAP